MAGNYKKYNDAELVAHIRDKTSEAENAFREIYRRYSPRLHAYCHKIFNHEATAEDIFQETFMRFYQYVGSSDSKVNVPGYLITIARNLSLNHKRRAEKITYTDELRTESHDPNNDNKELLDLISMALEILDFNYKEAFILREYNGLSYNEIAEVTGISVTNAKTRVFRAKKKIKKILKPYMMDLERNIK